MPKKSKKSRRPNVPLYTGPIASGERKAASGAAPPVLAPARREMLSTDYAYVVKDLKRIGLLAGVFIGLMVIASFLVK